MPHLFVCPGNFDEKSDFWLINSFLGGATGNFAGENVLCVCVWGGGGQILHLRIPPCKKEDIYL